jgi:hypothetical protein
MINLFIAHIAPQGYSDLLSAKAFANSYAALRYIALNKFQRLIKC